MSGRETKLTGDDVKRIRDALGESQKVFADRIAVTQPVIHRIEKKGSEVLTGPEIILIRQIADENGVTLPDAAQTDRVELYSDATAG